jgi:hypothetical protein
MTDDAAAVGREALIKNNTTKIAGYIVAERKISVTMCVL